MGLTTNLSCSSLTDFSALPVTDLGCPQGTPARVRSNFLCVSPYSYRIRLLVLRAPVSLDGERD